MRNVISFILNLVVAFVFFSFGYTEEGRQSIADAIVVPVILNIITLLAMFGTYSHARFIHTIVDGDPATVENFGGEAAWKRKMEEINKEINARLREEGGEPYRQTFEIIQARTSRTGALMLSSDALVALAFLYAGWFWTGLIALIAVGVGYICTSYLVKRLPRIVELSKM